MQQGLPQEKPKFETENQLSKHIKDNNHMIKIFYRCNELKVKEYLSCVDDYEKKSLIICYVSPIQLPMSTNSAYK